MAPGVLALDFTARIEAIAPAPIDHPGGKNMGTSNVRRASGWWGLSAALVSASAQAGHGSPEALGGVANVLAIFVLCIVPIVGIAVFWMVHVLPEKIAHKRNHPQTKAIQVLCLLSLVFGGLLWPIAWLWAYTKPVLYKMAYGTDQGDAHPAGSGEQPGEPSGNLPEGIARVRADLERLAAQGGAPRELAAIRDQLAALEPRVAGRAGEAR